MLCIILFSGHDDRGLILAIFLTSGCGIFRSGPFGTLQHCSKEEERRRKELDSNIDVDTIVPEVCLLPSHHWVTAVPVAGAPLSVATSLLQ